MQSATTSDPTMKKENSSDLTLETFPSPDPSDEKPETKEGGDKGHE